MLENSEKFQYESPLDFCCPLAYLKYVLMNIEKTNPDYFNIAMGTLNKVELDNLLLAIKHSEEYTERLKIDGQNKNDCKSKTSN